MRKYVPCTKSYNLRESPGGPLIRTPSFHTGGTGLIPGWETKTSQDAWSSETNKVMARVWIFIQSLFLFFFPDFLFYIGSIANSSDSFLLKSPNKGWSCRWPQKERTLSLQDWQRLSPPATSLPCLYFTYPGSASSKKHSLASNQSHYVVTSV